MQGIQPRGSLRAPAWGKEEEEEEEEAVQPTNGAEMSTGSGPCRRVYGGAWSHASPRPSRAVVVSTCPCSSVGLAGWVWGAPNPKCKLKKKKKPNRNKHIQSSRVPRWGSVSERHLQPPCKGRGVPGKRGRCYPPAACYPRSIPSVSLRIK